MDVCVRESKVIVSRFLTMVRGIWHNRNDWIWNRKRSIGNQILCLVSLVQSDWQGVRAVRDLKRLKTTKTTAEAGTVHDLK